MLTYGQSAEQRSPKGRTGASALSTWVSSMEEWLAAFCHGSDAGCSKMRQMIRLQRLCRRAQNRPSITQFPVRFLPVAATLSAEQ
jgi:hypothetical protein